MELPRRSHRGAFVVLLAALVTLAGCGGSDDHWIAISAAQGCLEKIAQQLQLDPETAPSGEWRASPTQLMAYLEQEHPELVQPVGPAHPTGNTAFRTWAEWPRPLDEIGAWSAFPLLWSKRTYGGLRVVLFLDGTTRTCSRTEFQELKLGAAQ